MGSHSEGPSDQRLALTLFIKFQRASNTLNSRLQRSLRKTGLTESQFAVLEMLLHLGPQDQNLIGKKMLRTGANTTFVVDKLERAGLVVRQAVVGDRRRNLVSLSERGDELIRRIFPDHAREITRLMEELTREEQMAFSLLCCKLGKGIADTEGRQA